MSNPRHSRKCIALLASLCLGCGNSTTGSIPPSQNDVDYPVAIDHSGSSPATYKGLPLSLTDNGAPTVTQVDGIIGVVCVGMSNATQECSEWISQLAASWNADVNPAVRVVDCAVGGNAIEKWIDPKHDLKLWDACRDQKLPAAGVRPDQVRVIWHKAANQFGIGDDGMALPFYPASGSDYDAFRVNLTAFADRVPVEFPTVQAVYTSSRSYGGFNSRPDRGEPLSYEEGHALNSWLAARSPGGGIWYGWGAYIWAPPCTSGATNGSGVCYEQSDYRTDGVHPNPSGLAKIVTMLHERMLRESWYRR